MVRCQKPVYAGPGPANGNVITLSESFYREIDAHRIPVERHVVAALAHAPGILDFYLWIVWKSWTVKGREVRVPLTGPGGLSLQLGTREYSRDLERGIPIRLICIVTLYTECQLSF